ncbi:hypothetical protein BDW22DRAFT_1425229 [Trametopsis cervina]|nr:hypothetical protein BDW22DRAFT_1425229 [Trametopsis cervina]
MSLSPISSDTQTKTDPSLYGSHSIFSTFLFPQTGTPSVSAPHVSSLGQTLHSVTPKVEQVGELPAKKRKPRRVLPYEASSLIKEYYYHVTTQPTLEQKRELLSRIHTKPGAEYYTLNDLTRWFGSRRRSAKHLDERIAELAVKDRASSSQGSNTLTTANILWPSLDAKKLVLLSVLYQENPRPDANTLEVWSRAIKADKDDIENWVQLNSLKPAAPTIPLPTPDATASPEPLRRKDKMALYSPSERFVPLPPSPITPPAHLALPISAPPLHIHQWVAARAEDREPQMCDVPPPPLFRGSRSSQLFIDSHTRPISFTGIASSSLGKTQSAVRPIVNPLPRSPTSPVAELPSSHDVTMTEEKVERTLPSASPEHPIATAIDPRQAMLRNLATAVLDGLNSESSAGAISSPISLDDFDKRMQKSLSFFEEIKSGAYASLGLVLR